ncbi:MAG: 30S ribosomal protein S6 [Acidobacteria bacterium]|nr:30S ribosomal protein S6 [Acidobacteriota bacterium]
MATYESIFILNAQIEDELEEKVVSEIRALLEKNKCNIKLELKWGKRPLAYLVKKQKEGNFYYFVWESKNGNIVDILQGKVKVTDPIIRAFHIRIDEELRLLKKRYTSGKETNIAGVLRRDGAEKEDIDVLELIYHEPTAIYLREEY